MCGIAGVVHPDPDRREPVVRRMMAALHHRGPDDRGLHDDGLACLGLARLAIVDPADGVQPVFAARAGDDPAPPITAVVNGELYDHLEHRRRLEAGGWRFRSRSDAEVVPALHAEHGADWPERVSGMFGAAVWDARDRTLTLHRDPMGKKPVYWRRVPGGGLAFASEPLALLADPDAPREPDPVSLHHYLSLRHVPAPRSAWRGIRCLLPGGRLTFHADTGEVVEERRWRPIVRPEADMDPEWAVGELLARLRRAVAARLDTADVPVGALLSGGVDSSLLAVLAAEHMRDSGLWEEWGPLATFNLGYADPPPHKRDQEFARRVADDIGSDHHCLEVDADDLAAALPACARAFGEPFAGVLSPWFLHALVVRRRKVVIAGEGADELLGSYAHHRRVRAAAEAGGDDFDIAAWRMEYAPFGEAAKADLLTPEFTRAVRDAADDDTPPDTTDLYRSMFADTPWERDRRDPLGSLMQVDMDAVLADEVLVFGDRLSMAHSVEVRCPFLDRHVVDLCLRMPDTIRCHDRPGDEPVMKWVLKEAAAPFLPAELLHRPKEGFVLPKDAWLKGTLMDAVDERLSPESLAETGWFRPEPVRDLLEAQRSGAADNTWPLWVLTMAVEWWRSCVRDDPAPAAGVR